MRWRTLLGVVVVILAVLVPIGSAQATVDSDIPGLAWGPCPPEPGAQPDPRIECAPLRVPLDYRHPSKRQITVAVSRIATAKPGLRRGILLTNPGGPGGNGLVGHPSQLASLLPSEVLDRYDIIGFDPRGVGQSTPITCGLSLAGNDTLILPYPAPDGSIARNVAWAESAARGCAAHSAGLLPYITTANTARDMDRIRAAVGEPKLSYLGYSYGTYLGEVYATLFPNRTDRVILDSVIDPRHVWSGFWQTASAATDLRMPDFTAWAAERDATYHLGTTSDAVRHTYDRLAATLDRHPVGVPELSGSVDGNLFRELTRENLYFDSAFPALATVWQLLSGQTLTPGALTQALPGLHLTRARVGSPAADAPTTGTAVAEDNNIAVLYAIVCNDARWPLGPADHARAVAADRQRYPITAGMPANIWPCAYWPNTPVEPPVTVTDNGPRNILILQNRRDPATSLASGRGARAALAGRAVMVTVDAGGHGVYPGRTDGPCAGAIATAFLGSGTLPVADTSCAGSTPDDTTGGPGITRNTLRAPSQPLSPDPLPLGLQAR
jgi:pimeloyl-ACP methyl ester carboxylesterase